MTNQIKSFFKRPSIRHLGANTLWILGERTLTMSLAFAVSIVVSRYLGPERYGILSYAISFTTIFAIAGHLGLSGLVIKDIVKYPEKSNETLGTVFALKYAGILIGFCILLLFTFSTEVGGSKEFWVLLIVSLTIIFQPFEIFNYWFSAKIQGKYIFFSKITAITIASIIKVILVLASAGLIYFALTNVLLAFISATLYLIFFHKLGNAPIFSWIVSISRGKDLLSQGWMVFLGSIFAVIYLKVDQVMLRWLVDNESVGIYAIAANLSEAWYFIPTAIVTSLFPKLIQLREKNEKQYLKRFQQLFDFLFALACIVAIIISMFAQPLILLLYGSEYTQSAAILVIHIWAGLFIFMRSALSRWIIIENALVFSLITQGMGAFMNILLNLLLIPLYSGKGAAFATLISYAVASYISLLFYRRSRPIFWMMTRAIVSPIRYPALYFKK
ncbi:MAG: flippase [Candidatus Thiodiazotropha sp.]